MTRIEFFSATSLDLLKVPMHEFMARVEAEAMAVKGVTYQWVPRTDVWTAMIVYGKGPTTTQRWSGGTLT